VLILFVVIWSNNSAVVMTAGVFSLPAVHFQFCRANGSKPFVMLDADLKQEGGRNFRLHGWQCVFHILYNVQQALFLCKHLFKKVYSGRVLCAVYMGKCPPPLVRSVWFTHARTHARTHTRQEQAATIKWSHEYAPTCVEISDCS
jgi:hypothetical protein